MPPPPPTLHVLLQVQPLILCPHLIPLCWPLAHAYLQVRVIAETGVQYISCGALTHSVTALDISLNIETQ